MTLENTAKVSYCHAPIFNGCQHSVYDPSDSNGNFVPPDGALTTLIATSVVRGSRQGESHGGVYLLDLERRRAAQPIDWNTAGIDWQGRGWDRGLRGIAFDGERVFIAASDELFAWSPEFRPLGSWRCAFLRHCHEIARVGRRLFLTSTAYDSVLGFDLDTLRFDWGLHIAQAEDGALLGTPFDPSSTQGPAPENRLHLNMVSGDDRGLFVSGLRGTGLIHFDGKRLKRLVTLPAGTHNAQPWGDGVLFNDTEADVVRWLKPERNRVFRVPRYPEEELTHTDLDDSRIARQAFGRGLCAIDDERVAAGSSPSTITVHNFGTMRSEVSVNLSMDLRNAIHGLEVWPFD